jgi:cysteine desulfurase
VGLGEACAIAAAEMETEAGRLRHLRDRFFEAIRARIPEVVLNGDPERRIPGNLNLGFPGADAEAVMAAMPEIAVSTGSACSSAELEPSYVLRALGVEDALAQGSLRIGFGRTTTEAEIDFAVERLGAAVTRVRAEKKAARRPASAA